MENEWLKRHIRGGITRKQGHKEVLYVLVYNCSQFSGRYQETNIYKIALEGKLGYFSSSAKFITCGIIAIPFPTASSPQFIRLSDST